jgi:hypothetical protein
MGQKQLYRDYELTLTSNVTNTTLTIKNDNLNGDGLRINFSINLIPIQNQSRAALNSFCTFEINVFNLSPQRQKEIDNGEYNQVTLNLGYRDRVNGGNKNSQPVLIKADIFNGYTFRTPDASIVTTFLGIQNNTILSTIIDAEDNTKFAKSLLGTVQYTRRQVFDFYVNKYLTIPQIRVEEQNLTGFDEKYNVLDPDVGFTFTRNTTVGAAISQIVGDRIWYIDNLNVLYVLPVPTTKEGAQPEFPASNEIFLDQTTGLLDVPIISPSKSISAKTLLNPEIRPLVRVKIDTQLGLQSTASRAPVSTFQNSIGKEAYSAKTVEAVVMSASYQGDSRSGQWTTTFQTFPADYVKILG